VYQRITCNNAVFRTSRTRNSSNSLVYLVTS
jgi:hypothetical protein